MYSSTVFFMARQPLVGQGLFNVEASPSHSDTPPLDERSVRLRDLFLTTHSTRQTTMFTAGFEPAIPVSERP
jgi:hypothetical protein